MSEVPAEAPRVSVVITAFNRAHIVGRAIASVLAQTFDDYEIVLVDDASSDDLAGVVAARGWPKLRLVRNPVNRGIGGAKNAGIQAARGRYIAFLDSDDEWLPHKLKRQIAALEARTDGVPLSFTAYTIVRETGQRVARVPRPSSASWFEAAIRGEMFALGSTLVADRLCFQRVGLLDERIRRMEDRDWILRYFDHWSDLAMIYEPSALIHNSGWPSSDVVRASMAEIYALNKTLVSRHGTRYDRMLRSGMAFEIATVEYRNREYVAALSSLTSAVLSDPTNLGHMLRRLHRKLTDKDAH